MKLDIPAKIRIYIGKKHALKKLYKFQLNTGFFSLESLYVFFFIFL